MIFLDKHFGYFTLYEKNELEKKIAKHYMKFIDESVNILFNYEMQSIFV